MNRPERTCVGCRRRAAKTELIRLVGQDGVVVVDVRQTEPGRGAYLHRRSECLDWAVRRRAVGRALKNPSVDAAGWVEVAAPFLENVSPTA